MNHVYRLKRSGRTQQLQPVPETARAAGKGTRTGKTLAQAVTGTLASFALGGIASLAYAQQAPPAVNQLPQGGVVSRGSANIVTNTGQAQLTVNQSSNRAVIDWASFNVGSQAKVQFNQPSSSAVTLNNILGNNASQIYGQISANGQVFLSNPNGVYFSPTAQVNVGGLVATTGKANADEFMAGKASFNRGGSTGSVVNQGQLTSAAGGYIALLAPEVRNQGVVIAQAGTVALASGEAITLNFNHSGTGLAGITTTPQAIAALVENRSAVLAEGGQIILSAHALASLQGAVVKNSGQLSATSLSTQGGKIVLMGDKIELTSTSQIEANGPQGGGTVLVGGDWQGTGDTRQATKVTMAPGASIEANATSQGDGGKVVVWSDVHKAGGLTQVDGRIEAKGAGTGNGGQVETSGHTLQVGAQTQVNTGGGEWLLDPSDITISSGTTSGIALASNTYTPTTGAASSVVSATTLVNNLATNSINITTTNTGTSGAGTGNITVAANLSWASTRVLTLTAAGGISGSGNIDMTGAGGLIFNQAGNSTYAGSISGSNATFTKQGAGNLTLTGATNTYSGLTTVVAGTLTAGVANAFGTGDITVSGGTLNLGDFSQTSGFVTIPNTGSGGTITSTSNGLLVGSTFNFTNASRTTTISANLAGSGKITNTGSTLILTGNLANTGGFTVNSGTTIQIGDGVNSGSFDVTGSFTVGGTLAFNRPTDTIVPTIQFSAGGRVANLFYGTVLDLSATTHTGTMVFSPSVNMTAATPTVASILLPNSLTGKTLDVLTTGFQSSFTPLPVITWAGTPTGSPTLKLNGVTVTSGADAVGGKLTKNSGDLSIGPGALWSFTTAGSTRYFNVTSDATDTTLSGTSSINVAQGVSATQSGAISDTVGAVVGLTVRGGGTLTLSGNNSNFSGLTTVSAGTLKAGSSTAFGTGAISVTSGASLDLNGQAFTGVGNLTLNGTGVNNSGALMNSGAAATYSGPVLLGSSSRIVGGTGTIALTNTSQILGAGSNLTLGGAAGGSFAAVIRTSTGNVTKEDIGTWVLSGTNSDYSGGTTISAGTLKAGSATAFGTGVITVNSGAALDLNGQTMTSTGGLTLNGTGISNGGALMNSNITGATYAGLVSLGSASFIMGGTGAVTLSNAGTVTGAYGLTLGGAQGGSIASIIGTTTGTLTKQDAGTWTLSGVNTYTGDTFVNGGTLTAGVATKAFGSSSAITVNGGTLALGSFSQTVGAVTIGANGGALTSSTGVLTGASYTFNNTSAVSVSAILAGSGSITQTGTGTTTLSRVNTYSGGTFINGGTLQISSDANLGAVPSPAATTNITINGGTLAIAGQASPGFVIESNRLFSIGNSGGTIANNGSYLVTVNGAITSSGPVTLTGGDIAFGSITVSNASPILVKTTGNLTQNAQTTVSSQGGNITYWSDSDGDGSGSITLSAGISGASTQLNSGGGNILMGGGAGASAELGFARGLYAIYLHSYSNVQAGSGNVTLRGMSNTSNGMGVSAGVGVISGANVTITGTGYDNTTTGSVGVRLSGTNASASNLLTITGTGGGTANTSTSSGSNDGIFLSSATAEATGSGNVVINATGGGQGGGASNRGLVMQASGAAPYDSTIRSVTGTVTINAVAGAATSPADSLGFSTILVGGSYLGDVKLGGGATQTGALTLRSNSWGFDATGSRYTLVETAGPVTLEPVGASFISNGLNISYVSLASTITNLTLGKAGNTAPVYVGPNSAGNFPVSSYSVAGPISIYGDINLGTPLATTGAGANGLVTLTGNVTEVLYGKLTASSLLLAGTGASNVNMSSGANALGTIAGNGLGSVNIETGGPAASGAMTVGTVGGTAGLTASGPVSLSTYSGNLTLANDIVTSNTGTSAVTLNAGTVSIALGNNGVGNTTSGNVVLGGGTITTGTGGRARVYTGSIADSTGLGTLVGSGTGRFRYGSTASTTNYTTALGSSGYYAIYRERPTVSWSSSPNQTIAYGATPVSPTAGVVAGLANGDLIDTTIALRLASDNSLASTNANGFYNVGSYLYSRTEGAKALGYLVSNPTLTVGRATITVTANDASKTYNGLAYSGGNGVSYSGFAAGDTAGNAFKGSLTYWGSSQGAVNANSYTITPGGLALSGWTAVNYTIAFANGTLTVAKAPLTVRINNDARFFNETDASGYKSASYSGFVGGQRETTPGVLGGSLTISRSSSGPDGNLAGLNTLAGTYTGVLTATGLTAANYSFNYVSGNYTIVPADQLLVQVANTASTYASTPAYTVTSAKYFRSVGNTLIDLTSRVQITGGAFTLDDGAGGNTAFNLGASVPSLSLGGQLNVGAYQLGASSIVTNANYSNTMTLTGALQVNPKPVTAAVTSSVSKAYDGKLAMNGLTLGVTGAVTGDAVSASGAGAYDAKDVGTGLGYSVKNIALAGVSARNYLLTDSVTNAASNTLIGSNGVITAVPLTVTANNDSKTYDNVAYSGGKGVSYSGFVNNETEVDLGGALAYGGTSQTATNAGTYTIVPSGYTSTNYTIGYGNGTLTINPVNVTAIAGALQGSVSKVYDGNNTATLSSANYSLTGWVGSDGATVTKTSGTYDTATAGTNKTVTVSLTDSYYTLNSGTLLSNYNLPTSISGPVGVISAKPVTVTNTSLPTTYDGVSTYGVLASGAAFTTSPLVGTDRVASVTQTPSGAGVTVAGIAQVGNFSVTASNAVMGVGNANNYSFSYVDSTHTVNPAVLSVTPITGALQGTVSKVYDGNNTATLIAGNYLLTGWASNEGATVTKTTGTYDNANAGSGKTVTVTLVDSDYTATGATNLSNYTLPTSISGAVGSISKAALTATGNSASVTYNGANQSVAGFTVSGLQGSDTVGSLSTVAASGATGKNAGSYTNTVTAGTETNYTVSTVNGSLAIAKAALTATGNSASVTYNGANQSVSGFTVSGLQGSDTVDSLSSVVASGATGKNAGSYTNTVTAGTETNYTLSTVNGSLAIAKANATVTANSGTSTYNGADQTVSGFTASGLVGGESPSVLTGVSASRTEKNAGTYATTASGTDGNYNLTFVDGSMVIHKAALAVRVNDDAKFVTQADAAGYAGVSYSGFVNGESDSVVGGTLAIGRSASGPDGNTSASSNAVGSYTGALTASGLTSPNYTLSYQSGNYRVIPADQLLIKLSNASTIYGSAANYSVTEAKYLNQSNTIVDLTGSVTRSVSNGTTSFAVSDGVGGSARFAVAANGAVLSGAGQLSVGAYQLGATGVSVTSNNFSSNLALVGALEVKTAPLTPALAPTKVYDGTPVLAGLTLGVAGAQTGDVVSATGTGSFATKNAGTGMGYSVANLALTGTDARNYYLTGMGVGGTVTGANGTITPAPLTVNFTATDKVYDGNTSAVVTPTDNRFAGDVLSVSATGNFADKNVGTAKPVNVTAVALSGADAANYTVSPTASSTATITRLAQVTWVGGPKGSWFDPANWAGGAVPDLANVANVTIPAGVSVSFDNIPVVPAQAGPVSIDSLGVAGSLSQSAGALNVGTGGVTLNTLTQTGGELTTTGALTLGSLSQSAGSLSAGSLSTTTSYSQTGTGTINVTGDVSITATTAPVLLGNLNTGGTLNVNSTGGSITQTAGTVLTVTGPATLTASQNGAPANVDLGNAGNTLSGPVTVSGADVTLTTTGPLTASVTATGDATLKSGGTTTLGASTVGGDLSVTSTGDLTQTAPLSVAGTTTVNATPGDVVLSNPNNNLTGVVTAQGTNVTVNTHAPQTTVVTTTEDATLSTAGTLTVSGTAGSLTTQSGGTTTLGTTTVKGDVQITTNNGDIAQTGTVLVGGAADLNAGTGKVTLTDPGNGIAGPVTVVGTGTVSRTEGMRDDPSALKRPVVLMPALQPSQSAYKVTVLKLPQQGTAGNEAGLVHIELRDSLADVQIALPDALQSWIKAAGTQLALSGADGVELSEAGDAMRLQALAERSWPLNLTLRSAQGQLAIRLVKAN